MCLIKLHFHLIKVFFKLLKDYMHFGFFPKWTSFNFSIINHKMFLLVFKFSQKPSQSILYNTEECSCKLEFYNSEKKVKNNLYLEIVQ